MGRMERHVYAYNLTTIPCGPMESLIGSHRAYECVSVTDQYCIKMATLTVKG